jgi:hypothetical protein
VQASSPSIAPDWKARRELGQLPPSACELASELLSLQPLPDRTALTLVHYTLTRQALDAELFHIAYGTLQAQNGRTDSAGSDTPPAHQRARMLSGLCYDLIGLLWSTPSVENVRHLKLVRSNASPCALEVNP